MTMDSSARGAPVAMFPNGANAVLAADRIVTPVRRNATPVTPRRNATKGVPAGQKAARIVNAATTRPARANATSRALVMIPHAPANVRVHAPDSVMTCATRGAIMTPCARVTRARADGATMTHEMNIAATGTQIGNARDAPSSNATPAMGNMPSHGPANATSPRQTSTAGTAT